MGIIESQVDHGVMTITLNDVDRRNVISRALLRGLVELIDVIDASPDVRVVVLTNHGSVFCAGANLNEFSAPGASSGTGTIELSELFMRIRQSPKPWVGRINGHCMGGGVGLAAVMDISVAVDTSKFGFSEVRLGVSPAVISVVVLPKLRFADAQAHFLRGDRFSADRAAEMGLINESVSEEDLDAAVTAIINDLLAGAPDALAVTKRLAMNVPNLSIDDAFAWTAQVSAERFASDEAREGMSAFFEKRPAQWVRRIPTDGA
jgi:methylglutaconyl-CoA hydratase